MIATIVIAYITDLIFGDPLWRCHPVRLIGRGIKKLEPFLRPLIKNERLCGAVFAFIIVGISWSLVFLITRLVSQFNQFLGVAICSLFIYTSLAIKDLRMQTRQVYQMLKNKDLTLARKRLSMIVGRDTQSLNKSDIIRATVETIAENTVDGILSPLFYAFIGGAPLALAYKAINTLDSMIGYKNKRYKDFGWAAAKIDDLANFIPARLSALFLPLASWLATKDCLNSWRIIMRDSKKNPSPNSGIPQAAVAGALGIQLGGLNFYNHKPYLKPLIGDSINALNLEHIHESIKISYLCSALFLVSGVFIILAIGRG
jgi:adenosylcobinamide-phosphate synthase